MLFRADIVNNGRYRYVIPSFKDDEKSSCAVHKNITDAFYQRARSLRSGRKRRRFQRRHFAPVEEGNALEKRVLTTDRNAASFTSKILKKINALRPKLRRLPCPGVHGPLRGACESSRGLTLPQARSGLRAVSVLPRRAVPCQGEVHSMFAVRCHGNNPLQTKCIVCTRHGTVLLVAPKVYPPVVRLVATEGTVAGVKKCHRTGRDTTVNSERGECRRGRQAPCALRDKSFG
ncbi:hypothetical protein ALC57_07050 [Trachymyrmex cornetzi]|uniref:Uncharacterized protein n=1 Tax=Trachymyrmex cornetzi TaxID=471704 RepID=A0A195E645_9HYME|nr:hypothetical protein ALC57_07050 [Trachymyrmex cornetzi]